MKELSIEEKAKAYDEAIKRAKSKIKNDKDHVLYEDDVIDIFPELKESEDERIRKAIRTIILSEPDIYEKIGFSRSDCLAWLEKQGEHTDIPSDAILDSNKDGLIADTIRCKREKQGEQKSYASETMNEKGDFDSGFTRMMEKEQKLAEWSEEDETITSALSQLLKDCEVENSWNCVYSNDREVFFVDIENWLKSLKDKVQPRQEWSEEDEKKINELIELCKGRKKLCSSTVISYKRMDVLQDWLKSLRPQSQWKPSGEHIKALEDSIVFLDCTKKVRDNLKSLYEQLKKLREE